jgi:ActR/RegA family two-component response regulator
MSGVRLLFVDDEPTILLTLSTILGQRGFDVTTAASVPAALALINSETFDVLISDLNIGEPGDGFTVVSAMRRVQPQAATFILTGYPDFESALLAIRNQVDDYFTKPADVNSLIATITEHLSTVKRPLRAIPPRRLSDVLRDNVQRISDECLRAAQENPELAAIPLSKKNRLDHISWMLKELQGRLQRASEDTTEKAIVSAQEHGRLRYREGYSISQIVVEARILQRAITTTVQANLLGVDVSTLVPDLVEIGESLASMLEASVRSYQEHSDAAAPKR